MMNVFNQLVNELKRQQRAILREILRLAHQRVESYKQATVYDQANIENTINATLIVIFQLLEKENINKQEFDNMLADLGERRARQGIPLADVVGLFKIVREILMVNIKKEVEKKPAIDNKDLIHFTTVLNELFDRIDMGIVKQYIEIKDAIIQVQQSFLKHKFSSLFQLVESISNNLNIDEFCANLLDYLNRFYNVKISAVFLLDDKQKELYPQLVRGLSVRYQHEHRLPADDSFIKKLLDEGQVVVAKDKPYQQKDIFETARGSLSMEQDGEEALENELDAFPECTSIYAPLIGRQRTYGFVSLHSIEPLEFTSSEIQQFETLARIVTVAIENARFYQNIIEEKGKLDAIVNSVTDGLILIDFHEEIVFINEQAAKYFQLPAYKLMGASASMIPERLLQQAKDPYTVQSVYLRSLSTIMDHPVINFTLYKPDLIDVRLTMFPVRDREHHFIGRGLLIENISYENEVNRMKSEFVALASHTMRTPMTSILGFSSLLLESKLTDKIKKKYMTNIHREAKRLTSILNDMLEMANIEAGKIALKLNPVGIHSVVEKALHQIKQTYKQTVELKMSTHRLPTILADQDKVEKSLYNLMANAVKYADSRVTLTVKKVNKISHKKKWIHSHLEEPIDSIFPAIQFSVEDDGPGIGLDQLDAIFEPFYRLPVEKQYVQEGSGLGLTIAKYCVEMHGGRIWAETKEGKGSLFVILMPVELARPNRSIAHYDR